MTSAQMNDDFMIPPGGPDKARPPHLPGPTGPALPCTSAGSKRTRPPLPGFCNWPRRGGFHLSLDKVRELTERNNGLAVRRRKPLDIQPQFLEPRVERRVVRADEA